MGDAFPGASPMSPEGIHAGIPQPYPVPPVPVGDKLDRWWTKRPKAGSERTLGWDARWSAYLIAAGSLLLLPAPLVWLVWGDHWLFALSVPAVGLQLLGWTSLGADLRSVPGAIRPSGRRRKGAMTAAYAIAWAGFLLGLGVLLQGGTPLLSRVQGPPFWEGRLLGPFPYLPMVYGPVVLAHAALFGLGRRFLPGDGAGPVIAVGSALLAVTAGTGLGLQILVGLPAAAYLLAGVAGGGYLLVAAGWGASPEGTAHSSPLQASDRNARTP